MYAKERMLTALSMGIPDRIPATLHQWQPYHLKNYMGGISDIEAFRNIGMDAAITYCPFISTPSYDWKVSSVRHIGNGYMMTDFTVLTPEGTLTYKTGTNEYTAWVTEHMIKNDDDIYLLKKYYPIPRLDKKALEAYYDELGDGGIMRMFITGYQGGCWQDACELYGAENLIMATYDKPGWVHEFMDILLEQKLEFIYENLKGVKVDLIETGGGAASSTLISPKIHREYCLPYDSKIHRAIHEMGYKVVYHTCGGMMGILDLIAENGCDASETLSPPGVGGNINDPAAVKREIGRKVALIGGMDQVNILTNGTPKEIRDEVFRLFEAYGPGGGYIMSGCDHFFHTPAENLRAFADAAKECNY